MRLFAPDRVERPRWRGNVLPVLAAPLCPGRLCGAPLVVLPPVVQPALFLHGGYGAARRSAVSVCVACGWTAEVLVESANPRKLGDDVSRET